jgi:hypothetical protein
VFLNLEAQPSEDTCTSRLLNLLQPLFSDITGLVDGKCYRETLYFMAKTVGFL